MTNEGQQNNPPETFEAALAELSQIVSDLEDSSVGLEESLKRFEQGMSLLRHCHRVLNEAEQRIEQLTGLDAEGNEVTVPFEATATIDDRRESAGRRRRSKTKAKVEAEEDADDEDADVGPRLF
jgi:exodeoxyribonuclease VII small subunit